MRTAPLLALLLLAPATAAAFFTDVPMEHPYYRSISVLAQFGVLQGYADRSYKPNAAINRAEFLKLVVAPVVEEEGLRSCRAETERAQPSDVAAGDWFAPYVCSAIALGAVQGHPDGTFRPGENILFAEAAKIVAIAWGLPTVGLERPHDWWEPYVLALAEGKSVPKTVKGPAHVLTRGEMAEMLYLIEIQGRRLLAPGL